MLIPVILSGGAGTRLWPLSRELYPKQFLPLVGERTMIQETALRTAGLPDVSPPIVVCNEAHRSQRWPRSRARGVQASGSPRSCSCSLRIMSSLTSQA
jgi:mannose-1-phosphate guanylyltransferase/mannose-6-phosphate isomerase